MQKFTFYLIPPYPVVISTRADLSKRKPKTDPRSNAPVPQPNRSLNRHSLGQNQALLAHVAQYVGGIGHGGRTIGHLPVPPPISV